jgi:hypothetical protein
MPFTTRTAGPSGKAARIALVLATSFVGGAAVAETGRSVLVVLDASGSMNARLPEGRTRLEAAKAAVSDFVGDLPSDIRLGLRVYGHQSAPDRKNCQDTELLAGFAPAAEGKQELLDKVAGLKARGYTPITLSLKLAAEDIAKEPSAERTVVLVSDGRETCSGDPCVAAKALAAADAKLVVHTIGLGVDAAARSQLQCIASVARGSYFDAHSRAELAATIGKAAVAGKNETVTKVITAKTGILSAPRIKEGGVPVIEAETGKAMDFIGGPWPTRELPVGIYSVKLNNGLWTGIEIKAGATTVLEPAFLRVDVAREDAVAQNVDLLDPETGEELGYFLLTTSEVAVVPGRVMVRIDQFVWPATEVTPGQVTVLKPGVVKVNDPLANAGSVLYQVSSSTGEPVQPFWPNSPVYLPAGKYLLWALDTPSQKTELEVTDGQTLEIKVERR